MHLEEVRCIVRVHLHLFTWVIVRTVINEETTNCSQYIFTLSNKKVLSSSSIPSVRVVGQVKKLSCLIVQNNYIHSKNMNERLNPTVKYNNSVFLWQDNMYF